MRKKWSLTFLLAFTGWAGLAHGQTGLGTLTVPEPATCPTCAPAPRFPLLASLMRNVFTPGRVNAPPLQPPQPIVEATPTREDIARMVADGGYSPAEITAAKIKMDEAQATSRQAAVRYLATVDCHYYPEAEMGLVAALRADRSEAVRLEAATALGTCRGTTVKMLEALNVAALGLETDGNPSESSERVRLAARASLHRTLASGVGMYPYAPPPMMPVMPTPEWMMPEYAVQPAAWYVPYYQQAGPPPVQQAAVSYVPAYQQAGPPPVQQPALLTVTPEERKLAETVGLTLRSAPTTPVAARSLLDWLQQRNLLRASGTNGPSAGKTDPRLQGLAPLGSDATLALPAGRSNPAITSPRSYNNE